MSLNHRAKGSLTKAQKKEQRRLEEEVLEEAVKKSSIRPMGIVFFVFFALATAATTVYLYTTVVFDLHLMEVRSDVWPCCNAGDLM